MDVPKTVLLVDDDPSHLKLYSLIVASAGYRALTALAGKDKVDLPAGETIDLAVLDYRLGNGLTAREVAKQVNASFPTAPVLILSDMLWMPDDIAPFAAGFVRKGEPQQLLDRISALLSDGGRPPLSG